MSHFILFEITTTKKYQLLLHAYNSLTTQWHSLVLGTSISSCCFPLLWWAGLRPYRKGPHQSELFDLSMLFIFTSHVRYIKMIVHFTNHSLNDCQCINVTYTYGTVHSLLQCLVCAQTAALTLALGHTYGHLSVSQCPKPGWINITEQ